MGMTGAQIILEMLKQYNVKHVFGLPGETTIGLYDQWLKEPDIEYILTRDEKNSAFMAEAYSKISGKPGVVESPSPGVTHSAPGIAEAFAGSIPLIFFTSDVNPNDHKRGMLTGIDQTDFYSTITKESFILDRAKEIPFLMRRAFRVATSGKPGPVHLRIMVNCLDDEADVTDLYGQPECSNYPSYRSIADPRMIEEALNILMDAETPLIVCGQGALSSGAGPAVRELAETLEIPIGTTITGKGIISEFHPMSIGVVGSRGGRAFTNAFIERADVIFYIGSNTDSTGTDGWQKPKLQNNKKIIHLDISPENLGNMYHTSVSLCGDAKFSLEYMLKTVKENNLKRSHELDNFAQERDRTRDELLNMEMPDINKGIFPPYFVKVLNEILPENSIITTEAGVCSIYTTPLLTALAPGRRYLSNYSLGALGYAIPAALGAAFADENAPVLALGGDGSFGFNCGELETFSRTGKNITIILYRNDSFGWIRGETVLVNDSEPFCTDFDPTVSYLKVAQAFGLQCQRLEKHEDIRPVLEKAMAHNGPSFIEMPVVSEDVIAPFVPKWISGAKKKNRPSVY